MVLYRRKPLRSFRKLYRDRLFRTLSLVTVAVVAFFLGGWLSYAQVLHPLPTATTTRRATPIVLTPSPWDYDSPPVPLTQTISALTAPASPATRTAAPVVQQKKANHTPPTAPARQTAVVTSMDNKGGSVPASFRGKIVDKVAIAPNQKVVALTFDDGPWGKQTEQVLSILRETGAHSTFFVIGRQVKRDPKLVRRIVEEGHAIGNHTWNHPVRQVSAARAVHEIDDTRRAIEQATSIAPVIYRPPGGNLRTRMVSYSRGKQDAVVMWSVDTKDFLPRTTAARITQTVLSTVKPGGIVLMHDGGGDRTATLAALPQIINGLQQQGYRFVTVPELLKMQHQKKS